MQNKSKKKIKKTKKQEIKYEKDYPKDDDLINRRVATHGYPEVSKERLKENRQYWGNRNDLDQTTISLDWNRAVYTSEIGGFSYDGPKVYFNDAYVYTHQMSLDLEGRLKIDDHNRYASLTQYNREKFNYTNVLVDVVPFDSNKNIWFKNEGFQSDYIGKARLFRSGNPENRVLNFNCWITIPDYAIRSLASTLDSYMDIRLTLERFTNISESLEESQEMKIFHAQIFHNRPSSNTKHRLNKISLKSDIENEPFVDSSLNKKFN